MIAIHRMAHEHWDCETRGQADRARHPVNVLSDNANGAAPLERPAPGSRGVSS